MQIIAFAGSNSSKSINHQLITYAATNKINTKVIRLSDYDIPMYNIDIEENVGIPKAVKDLDNELATADAFIISVAEHNGNITAFFKNILDWLSRNNRNFLENKKVVLLSSSPGKGGAASSLQITQKTLPYFKANVVASLSVPGFFDNFKDGIIINNEIDLQLKEALAKL